MGNADLADVFYHGTTMEYVGKMVREFGHYEHIGGKQIYLSTNVEDAKRKATEFGVKFNARPVVLEINRRGLSGLDTSDDMWPVCNSVNTEFEKDGDGFTYLKVLMMKES